MIIVLSLIALTEVSHPYSMPVASAARLRRPHNGTYLPRRVRRVSIRYDYHFLRRHASAISRYNGAYCR
ncbi:unnamed protein product, partial [Ectocarpus sp. 12 AP-2014]